MYMKNEVMSCLCIPRQLIFPSMNKLIYLQKYTTLGGYNTFYLKVRMSPSGHA